MDQFTIEAARRGDRVAQANLLRQLQDPWFRFSVSLLGSAEDARDAVQETALRFLRDLPRFRGDSSILTWSMGIAVNVARELRRKRRPISAEEEMLAAVQGGDDSPVDHAALDESQSLLHQTLRQLPERQREALVLRYLQDLSIEETARAMDCAPGTVKATVHQALRTLREKLKQLT